MTFMGGSCPLGKLYCQRQICVESDCDAKEKFIEHCDIVYIRRSNKREERGEKTMIKTERVKDGDRSYCKWKQRATNYLLYFPSMLSNRRWNERRESEGQSEKSELLANVVDMLYNSKH